MLVDIVDWWYMLYLFGDMYFFLIYVMGLELWYDFVKYIVKIDIFF